MTARHYEQYWGGIFCLEGEWEEDLTDRSTVLPVLELLEKASPAEREIRFTHRKVSTLAEFEHCLLRWAEEVPYYVLYLAFHGTKDGIYIPGARIGDAPPDIVPLTYIGELVRGLLSDCVIHVGSCSVMAADDEQLDSFLLATGARAIVGFTRDTEWMDGSAVDLIVLSNLAWYEQLGRALSMLERAEKYASLREPPLGLRVHRHPGA